MNGRNIVKGRCAEDPYHSGFRFEDSPVADETGVGNVICAARNRLEDEKSKFPAKMKGLQLQSAKLEKLIYFQSSRTSSTIDGSQNRAAPNHANC